MHVIWLKWCSDVTMDVFVRDLKLKEDVRRRW